MSRSILQARFWILTWSFAILASVAMAIPAWGQTPTITRIEEDWELVIDTPSPNSDAPQVTCTMSPVANTDSLHATFMVNHSDTPAFEAGGLQLQMWNGKTPLATQQHADQAILTTVGEEIRWTQVMAVTPDGLLVQVVNGTSTTWGQFGSDVSLKITTPTTLTNLDAYTPEFSVSHSGVSYASNRVRSLVLKRVRAYSGDDLVAEDDTPRVVHQLQTQP